MADEEKYLNLGVKAIFFLYFLFDSYQKRRRRKNLSKLLGPTYQIPLLADFWHQNSNHENSASNQSINYL